MATIQAHPRRHPSPRRPPCADTTTDRSGFRIPASALTLSGFRNWATSDDFPEHIRAAFVDGEIFIEMSNEDLETHVAVKAEISRLLMNLNREYKLGKFYSDGVLISNEDASVSNNPDASFFTIKSFESGRVRLVPKEGKERRYREIEGAPDWVLEVISDSSVQKDTARLREAYHKAGILEYWLVDARGDEIHFQILNHRKHGYAATPVRDGWQRSRVFGRAFRLDRQRDAFGLWEYTLHIQSINS